MKKINPCIKDLDDALIPQHYDSFVLFVNAVTRFDGIRYSAPSLVGEIGRSIKLVGNRRIIHYIKLTIKKEKKDVEKWLHVYYHEYYNTVGRNALRAVQRKRWGKIQ